MAEVGILGTGISGLHVALFLQHAGVETAVYAERTPDEIRGGRLPNTVARFGHTRARERALGIHLWDAVEYDCPSIHVQIPGDPPLGFRGDLHRPYTFLDFRIYLAALLEEYERRGGRVIVGPVDASDVVALSGKHELMVVASGRDTAARLFPRDAERSPYTVPQRTVCAGIFRGIAWPDPPGVSFNISPGVGEIFQGTFHSFDGPTSNLLFEALPGGPLQAVMDLKYEDDPGAFNRTVLELVKEHAPSIFERIDQREFGLTRPLDLVQGAITPVVRKAWASLGNGKYAVAVGDAWVLNDPITGQGANLGSHCAEVLAQAIIEDLAYDEWFCRTVEARMWAFAEPVVAWTNAFLQPPPPHVIDLVVAAATDQRVADAFAENFDDPQAMWRSVATQQRTEAFCARARAAT